MIGRLFLVALISTFFTGCSTTSQLKTYDYGGIDLGSAITGPLILQSNCLMISSEIGPVSAVFPKGTKIEDQVVTLPQKNGGAVAVINRTYIYEGGFRGSLDGGEFDPACPDQEFIINRVKEE